jgi:hypothetical protein
MNNTLDYPEPVMLFRGFMELVVNSFPGGIWIRDGVNPLKISYAPKLSSPIRDGWVVTLADGSPDKAATILAYQTRTGKTVIQFYDGCLYAAVREDDPNLPTTLSALPREALGKCLDAFYDDLFNLVSKELTPNSLKPQEPQTAVLTDWFDYYYAVTPRMRIKMEYIAERVGLAVSTVYKEHTLYKNSHGIEKRKHKVSKSKR